MSKSIFITVLLLCVVQAVLLPQDGGGDTGEDSGSAAVIRQDEEDPGADEYADVGEDQGITITEEQDPVKPEVSPYGQRNTVSARQITEQGSHDLLDALRNMPGVSFSKRNSIGGDTGTSLYIRGRGASHPSVETVTNFDGVPRNGAIYGQSMPDSFSLSIADRVDVYKSPQPSAFGVGYALVDVLPRYMRGEGWEAEAGASLGSFLTAGESASFGCKRDAFDIFAAQCWSSTAGHTEHSAAYQQSYYLNGGVTFNDNLNLRALANYVNARSERPRREGQNPADILPSFKTDSFIGTLTANNSYSRAAGYAKLYYSSTDFYWLDEDPSVSGDYSIQALRNFGARLKENLWLWKGGELIAGGDFDFTTTVNLDHNETRPSVRTAFPDMFLFSPYIAASHRFGGEDGFHAAPQAGIRGYIHTLWADAAAPQFGLVAGYKNTNIYGNYVLGCVYPAPANIQSLVNQDGADGADLKSVKPEVVYHYEAGIYHNFGDLASIGGAFFFDDGRNRIIAVGLVPENASLVSFFRITGVEFYGSVKPLKDLSVFAGGTWMKVEARGEDGKVVTVMPFTPDLSVSAGFTWKLSRFGIKYLENLSLSGDFRYLGGVYANTNLQFSAGFINSDNTSKLDDQHILRLRLSYALSSKKIHIDTADFFIDLDNVLNQRYEYWPGYRMPGITVTGGLNVKLK
jgi:iron complex outermembrane receptor protein